MMILLVLVGFVLTFKRAGGESVRHYGEFEVLERRWRKRREAGIISLWDNRVNWDRDSSKSLQRKVLERLPNLGTDLEGTLPGVPLEGDESCPCLHVGNIEPAESVSNYTNWFLQYKNATTYGVGCKRHDLMTPECQRDCDDCDKSWCYRAFCWVDPVHCKLLKRTNAGFFGDDYDKRTWSYATCRNADFLSDQNRLDALKNTRLKIGLASNTGGWRGAYSEDGKHFEGPLERWNGPLVEFAKAAAASVNMELVVTPPPEFLKARAETFFQSNNPFDFCTYATALGYIDMCLTQMSVTTMRGSSVDFYIVDQPKLHLIIEETAARTASFDSLLKAAKLIYEPFSTSLWLFLIFFFIPLMAILIIFHEYGRPGSAFESHAPVYKQDTKGDDKHAPELPDPEKGAPLQLDGRELVLHRVPVFRHVVRSLYTAFLGVMQLSLPNPVISYGAKLHLIGFSFMVLTVTSVYTANLAAILTSSAKGHPTENIYEAIKVGYRFCVERGTVSLIKARYGLDDKQFVFDNDGRPGFDFNQDLVLERVNSEKAQTNRSYCHAAIATTEHLEKQQSMGRHCNKEAVGTSVGRLLLGFPIFDGPQDLRVKLKTLFASTKNSGKLALAFDAAKENVTRQCDHFHAQDSIGDRVTIPQLFGVWGVSFGFAIVGIVVTALKPRCKRKFKRVEYHTVTGYDQWGHKIDKYAQDTGLDEAEMSQDSKLSRTQELTGTRRRRTAGSSDSSLHDMTSSISSPSEIVATPKQGRDSWVLSEENARALLPIPPTFTEGSHASKAKSPKKKKIPIEPPVQGTPRTVTSEELLTPTTKKEKAKKRKKKASTVQKVPLIEEELKPPLIIETENMAKPKKSPRKKKKKRKRPVTEVEPFHDEPGTMC